MTKYRNRPPKKLRWVTKMHAIQWHLHSENGDAGGKAKNAAAYPPKAGPDREGMLRALGLSHEADIVILAERRKDEQVAGKKAA